MKKYYKLYIREDWNFNKYCDIQYHYIIFETNRLVLVEYKGDDNTLSRFGYQPLDCIIHLYENNKTSNECLNFLYLYKKYLRNRKIYNLINK